ncbi:MAG: amino acid synthesis family protein [Chloroflexi bacterium]|nr:amino acid synthesis family protein [Chloroflexota bacterium]
MEIRRIFTISEDIFAEGGRKLAVPVRKVAAAAIIANPATGDQSGVNLDQFVEMGNQLGTILANEAMGLLGGAEKVQSFGKACLVGINGELEQAAILIHKEFGRAVRNVIGGGKAGIPSTKKVGSAGASIDVPLCFRDDAGLATHFDSIQVSVPGAPTADEIVVILGFTNGGRPHPWTGWN